MFVQAQPLIYTTMHKLGPSRAIIQWFNIYLQIKKANGHLKFMLHDTSILSSVSSDSRLFKSVHKYDSLAMPHKASEFKASPLR